MNWKKRENERLLRAVLSLKTADEAGRFLRDLLTEEEIKEFARRFQTAEMLAANVPYSAIEKKTGLSSTTVARVSKWLVGKGGGYRSVIGKLHHRSISHARGLS
jgi:TrpR-related protein YerC/YecD